MGTKTGSKIDCVIWRFGGVFASQLNVDQASEEKITALIAAAGEGYTKVGM